MFPAQTDDAAGFITCVIADTTNLPLEGRQKANNDDSIETRRLIRRGQADPNARPMKPAI